MSDLATDLAESIRWIAEHNKTRAHRPPPPKPIIRNYFDLPTGYELEAVHAQLEEIVAL